MHEAFGKKPRLFDGQGLGQAPWRINQLRRTLEPRPDAQGVVAYLADLAESSLVGLFFDRVDFHSRE